MYPKIWVLQWHIWLWVVFTLLHVVCGSAVTNLKIHKFLCVCVLAQVHIHGSHYFLFL